MDYEKKIKNALNDKSVPFEVQAWLEEQFPELKESKDEKIRKVIRGWIYTQPSSFFDNGISKKEILAWFEKQAKQNPNDKYTFKSIPRLLEMIKPTSRAKAYCKKLIDSLLQEGYVTDAKIVSDCLKQMNGEKVAMTTMDEQNPINEVVPKFKARVLPIEEKSPVESLGISPEKYEEIINECIYGEEKIVDEVKPKFHEGEWITNGNYTWKIVEVKPLDYILQSQDGNIVDDTISHVDEQFHSFTIEDAKNGDVLVSRFDIPFIYNGNYNSDYLGAYCGITTGGDFNVGTEKCQWSRNKNIHPATKEQRDLLFEKMKEAGYEWNDEKKELKKVEPKFKIGDWIVFNGLTLYVNEVVQGYYRTTSIGGIPNSYDWNIDNVAKLWTIQDAKVGDVLFHSDSASNGIFIFKKIIDRGFAKEIICYCDYDSEDHFCLGEHHTCCWTNAKILRPATKEQRDTLGKAMADAGYIFDFDKKELRKIEWKPADKVEPKFNVGDWITNSIETVQITGYDIDYGYQVDYNGSLLHRNVDIIEKEYHLWNIQDAKDGDVLVASDGSIFLFAGVVDYACKYYVALTTDNHVKIKGGVGDGYWETSRATYPATKEQRDFLFVKMKEAGYEWDDKKKELRKIE